MNYSKSILIGIAFFELFLTQAAFAQVTPTITTFTTSAAQIASGNSIGISWNIANASGYTLTITCGAGVTLKKTDNTDLACNTPITNTTVSTDAIDLLAYNMYGSGQNITFTLTPLDNAGAAVPTQTQNKSVVLMTEPNPINTLTSSVTTNSVSSFTPINVTWESKTGLNATNVKIDCQDGLTATSSSYQNGGTPLPCGTPLFSTDQSGSGSFTFSVQNTSGSDKTLTITILPGTGTGIYDGIHTRTLPIVIKPILQLPTPTLSFNSLKNPINSGESTLITWSVTDAIGFNMNVSCPAQVSIIMTSGNATSTLPCTSLALASSSIPTNSVYLQLYNGTGAPVPVTLTGLPLLSNNTYDGLHSKTLNLVLNPTTTQTTLLNTANSVTSTATPKKTITLLTKQLIKGSQNAEVKILQTYLSTDKTLYPEASVTGLFGPATERAVQRFQVKYGLAKKGVVGYGQVGPKTRAKFNELLLK
jgi:hypothetical protein